MNYLDNQLFYFSLDEYHYDEEFGAVQMEIINNLGKVFKDINFKKLISSFNILTDDIYHDIIKIFFTSKNVIEFRSNPSNYKSLDELNKKINDIINTVTTNSVTYFPVGYSKHAMGFLIHRIENTYAIYFHNTGLGTSSHNQMIDTTIKCDAIIKSTADETKFRTFLGFLLCTDNIAELYDNVLALLQTDTIYPISEQPEQPTPLRNLLDTSKTYHEIQYIGSCTYRSIVLPIYTYLVFIKKQHSLYFYELNSVIKLFQINDFLGKLQKEIDDSLNDPTKQIDIDRMNLFGFVRDLFIDKKDTYFSDNVDAITFINDIVSKINDIENTMLKVNKKDHTEKKTCLKLFKNNILQNNLNY